MRKTFNPSPEDVQTMSERELVEKYGCAFSTASRWRTKAGATKTRYIIPIPPREDIENLTVTEAAKKYGVSEVTAHRWLRYYGITCWSRRDTLKRLKSKIAALETLNSDMRIVAAMPFLTDAELGRAFNMTREAMRQKRNKFGVRLLGKKVA